MRLSHLGEQLMSTEIPTHPRLTPTLRNSCDPEKPGHTVSKGLDLAGSAAASHCVALSKSAGFSEPPFAHL